MAKVQLIRLLMGEITRATGRRYLINYDLLDETSLLEILRLLRDLDHEARMRASRAQRMPWRRP